MPSPISSVIEYLRSVVLGDRTSPGDSALLGCFLERRDEAALAVLVERHGPMVWGVCRRLLSHHDAEDAFQATFLVLVRKAASIVPREMLGNWLYGVAHQTALQARKTTARRRAREVQMTVMPDPQAAQLGQWSDVQPLLDQELSRLPDNYRAVIVLCDLEGRTRKEVARQLGVPEGTVAGRLARGRTMLAKRLRARGVTLSGGALATVLAQNVASAGVPDAVVSSTISAVSFFAAGLGAATGPVSVQVAALTEGVLKAMLISKLKAVCAVVLALAFTGTGTTVLCRHAAALHAPAGDPSKNATQEGNPVPPKDDNELLQGTWVVVSSGDKHSGFDKVTFTPDRLNLHYGDDPPSVCKYSLNATTMPRSIDIHGAENRFGGFTPAQPYRCIYRLDGVGLELAIGTPSRRPASFAEAAKEGTRVVLKRADPPVKVDDGPPKVEEKKARDAQNEVIEEIEKRGGQVERDEQAPDKPVIAVKINWGGEPAERLDDGFIKRLTPLTKLRKLHLPEHSITDAGIRLLSSFTELEHLDLAFTRITDAGVKHLATLKRLRVVRVSFSGVTEEGVRELQAALPNTKIVAR
jgi:RNA polymerase sigma factor (sigma-70 family)